jgi:hypothetical protein
MVRGARLILAGLLLISARVSGEEPAETVVVAPPPLESGVTIYRAAYDQFGSAGMDGTTPDRLEGYALISEVREVDLPAGPAVVRFPGVAAGMLAESVVVSGLPVGVREKNLDAQLLSPRHLYAGWFGRPVTLRRANLDGTVREERAVIRSAPDGAAIVQTDHGFEAVTCGPFQDSLVYPGVPPGLFAVPTLSIATDAPQAMHVRLRLAYLAWDYDWRADYVLKLAPDQRHGELSAWITLASADVTSFPNASAAVVAGKPNFAEDRHDDADAGQMIFHCFLAAVSRDRQLRMPPVPMMMAVPMPAPPPAMDIVVTARKAVVAEVENLGDLKLYRLPQPTTVAARSQKQVALFEPRMIAVELVHTTELDADFDEGPAHVVVRTRNRAHEGLGMALPAGHVRVLLDHGKDALVVGQGSVANRAINDRVDIHVAATPKVMVRRNAVDTRGAGWQAVTVTVSNANAFAVHYLGTFKQTPPASIRASSAALGMEDGHRVWAVTVPAHGRATLRYRVLSD